MEFRTRNTILYLKIDNKHGKDLDQNLCHYDPIVEIHLTPAALTIPIAIVVRSLSAAPLAKAFCMFEPGSFIF